MPPERGEAYSIRRNTLGLARRIRMRNRAISEMLSNTSGSVRNTIGMMVTISPGPAAPCLSQMIVNTKAEKEPR